MTIYDHFKFPNLRQMQNFLNPPKLQERGYIGVGTKVIIHKSQGEGSLVEQPTIDCVFLAYLKFIFKFLSKKLWFSHLYVMQLFCGDATVFKKKNCP